MAADIDNMTLGVARASPAMVYIGLILRKHSASITMMS